MSSDAENLESSDIESSEEDIIDLLGEEDDMDPSSDYDGLDDNINGIELLQLAKTNKQVDKKKIMELLNHTRTLEYKNEEMSQKLVMFKWELHSHKTRIFDLEGDLEKVNLQLKDDIKSATEQALSSFKEKLLKKIRTSNSNLNADALVLLFSQIENEQDDDDNDVEANLRQNVESPLLQHMFDDLLPMGCSITISEEDLDEDDSKQYQRMLEQKVENCMEELKVQETFALQMLGLLGDCNKTTIELEENSENLFKHLNVQLVQFMAKFKYLEMASTSFHQTISDKRVNAQLAKIDALLRSVADHYNPPQQDALKLLRKVLDKFIKEHKCLMSSTAHFTHAYRECLEQRNQQQQDRQVQNVNRIRMVSEMKTLQAELAYKTGECEWYEEELRLQMQNIQQLELQLKQSQNLHKDHYHHPVGEIIGLLKNTLITHVSGMMRLDIQINEPKIIDAQMVKMHRQRLSCFTKTLKNHMIRQICYLSHLIVEYGMPEQMVRSLGEDGMQKRNAERPSVQLQSYKEYAGELEQQLNEALKLVNERNREFSDLAQTFSDLSWSMRMVKSQIMLDGQFSHFNKDLIQLHAQVETIEQLLTANNELSYRRQSGMQKRKDRNEADRCYTQRELKQKLSEAQEEQQQTAEKLKMCQDKVEDSRLKLEHVQSNETELLKMLDATQAELSEVKGVNTHICKEILDYQEQLAQQQQQLRLSQQHEKELLEQLNLAKQEVNTLKSSKFRNSTKPSSAQPTTAKPITAKSTTAKPTTAKPTTAKPTTAKPTTAKSTTAQSTTVKPTTAQSTTAKPTTAQPTTVKPTTAKPNTAQPTTAKPTTAQPTTAKPTTAQPTTAQPLNLAKQEGDTLKSSKFHNSTKPRDGPAEEASEQKMPEEQAELQEQQANDNDVPTVQLNLEQELGIARQDILKYKNKQKQMTDMLLISKERIILLEKQLAEVQMEQRTLEDKDKGRLVRELETARRYMQEQDYAQLDMSKKLANYKTRIEELMERQAQVLSEKSTIENKLQLAEEANERLYAPYLELMAKLSLAKDETEQSRSQLSSLNQLQVLFLKKFENMERELKKVTSDLLHSKEMHEMTKMALMKLKENLEKPHEQLDKVDEQMTLLETHFQGQSELYLELNTLKTQLEELKDQTLHMAQAKEKRERAENERAENERAEIERAEIERAENERAENERAKNERAKNERAKNERAKNERAKNERAKNERAKNERDENERAKNERAENERAKNERAKNERAENERAENERAENERAENERAKNERAKNERAKNERAENERAKNERAKNERAENERAENERAENERSKNERSKNERSKNGRAENGRAENGRAENGRAENERAENEGAENEGAENEGAENGRAENGRAENGRAENGRAENGRAENEGAENEGAEDEGAENGRAENEGAENEGAENGRAENERAENKSQTKREQKQWAKSENSIEGKRTSTWKSIEEGLAQLCYDNKCLRRDMKIYMELVKHCEEDINEFREQHSRSMIEYAAAINHMRNIDQVYELSGNRMHQLESEMAVSFNEIFMIHSQLGEQHQQQQLLQQQLEQNMSHSSTSGDQSGQAALAENGVSDEAALGELNSILLSQNLIIGYLRQSINMLQSESNAIALREYFSRRKMQSLEQELSKYNSQLVHKRQRQIDRLAEMHRKICDHCQNVENFQIGDEDLQILHTPGRNRTQQASESCQTVLSIAPNVVGRRSQDAD